MSNSIPLRYDYMSHLPFFPAEGSKGCEIEEIRDPRDGYTHAKGQQIFTDLESSGHGKKDVGTLVSYRQDEGKTFPCKSVMRAAGFVICAGHAGSWNFILKNL